MNQAEKSTYVTLFYDVRRKLDISVNEYCLLEMVYHLSYRTGYCYKSPGYIAQDLGLTKRAVNLMVNRLAAKGLMERLTNYTLRVTDAYYSVQVLGGKKVPTLPASGKKVPEVGKKLTGWEKSTPNNNSENNNKKAVDNKKETEPRTHDTDGAGYQHARDTINEIRRRRHSR